ncbi:MAG: hypothetical protein KF802_00705 [Bdellovibrionaceae bacterium]|nr:hypothetical protein [Pseudobdellovibrionaceae bacterium]MBX3034995.1 hypothetical protein [Pseudobdellovibrionaceae bacterium]
MIRTLENLDAGTSLMLMSCLSVVLFCFCCYRFLREITKPWPVMNNTAYARPALQVGRAYKVFSWGLLMGFFLVGLVISFVEVFTRL